MAPISLAPEENKILDIKTLQIDRRRNSAGYPFKTFDEMSGETAAKNWLIKGILAKGETSNWIAPPGGLKSALLAQASISVTGGLDWQGKRNKGAAGVVYFALERADLVEKRIRAHCLRLGLKSLPIAVVAVTFDLIKTDSVKRVITTIQEAEAVFGTGVGLIIFDTFAKLIAAGGGDDVDATIRTFGQVSGPIVLVGHSYGGTVITHAGMDPRVAGLVYIAALGPDETETSQGQQDKFPKTDVLERCPGPPVPETRRGAAGSVAGG